MSARAVVVSAALLSLAVHAGPPKPVVVIAAAIDGARRSDGKKECTFTVEKIECALPVRVSCATSLMKYSYVMTLPLSKLDPKKSVYQANAGGFAGSHGVELTAIGAMIETITDDGQKTSGDVVVLAFGSSPDDEKRAKRLVATLPAAKKACK
jgi:hypothetical protein